MIQTKVVNEGPKPAELASIQIDLLSVFRSVLPTDEQDSAIPFEHQVAGWRKIFEGKEVGLVAGTAAGKTLTVSVPLFDKLFRQRAIQKILFLYPTLALMDDQYHILQKLLDHYVGLGLTEKDVIGRVRGGLNSTQLIGALGKPIIVATPDSVYWFFRKNIKYNAFLIYGLLQVDEVVIDEAHLFSGLMLQNAQHLLDRMRFLKKEYLGRTLKVHYLTATSNAATQKLSPDAYPPIPGKSKCGNIDLVIEAKMPVWEREQRMADLSREMLAQNKKHILVVCNSARRAHRIFDSLRDNRRSTESPDLPDIFWRTFGLVEIGPAMEVLKNLDSDTARRVQTEIQKHVSLSRRNLKTSLKLQPDYCMSLSAEWLEQQHRQLCQTLYRYQREAGDGFDGNSLQDKIKQEFRDLFGLRFRAQPDFDGALDHLNRQIDAVGSWLETGWGQLGSEPGFVELQESTATAFQLVLREFDNQPAGATDLLGSELSKYLSRNLSLTAQAIFSLEELGLTPYARQRISIRRLLGWVADDKIKEAWVTHLLKDVKKEHSAVGLLRDDPNGAVVILYSGSMARYAREGLIELFKVLDRPAVLIATSAVEVGVDFAADALITEECPASGFLQRFGRVGRREGLQSLVHVLVSETAYRELEQHLNGRTEISREEFSKLLSTQLNDGFQERQYLEISKYAEAAQRMITRQLGQVGETYLTQYPAPDLDELASNLTDHDIDPAYGLRGTLPGVSLADSGVSKDPFYMLSYVTNDDIEPPTNPFEVAQIRRYFNELIYKSWQRSIIVDIEFTLKANKAIVAPEDRLISTSQKDLSPANYFLDARRAIKNSPAQIRPVLLERGYKLPSEMLQTFDLLLGYGDVYLTSEDKETQTIYPVETYNQTRLRLPNQWYLILLGCNEEQAKHYLQLAGVGDFDSEVYYDFKGVATAANDIGVILLDRQAGAVWELWTKLRKVMRS